MCAREDQHRKDALSSQKLLLTQISIESKHENLYQVVKELQQGQEGDCIKLKRLFLLRHSLFISSFEVSIIIEKHNCTESNRKHIECEASERAWTDIGHFKLVEKALSVVCQGRKLHASPGSQETRPVHGLKIQSPILLHQTLDLFLIRIVLMTNL